MVHKRLMERINSMHRKFLSLHTSPYTQDQGVGIYKRKLESKKKIKHAFEQESDQEKKMKENTLSIKKAT